MGEVIDINSRRPSHSREYEPRRQGAIEEWGCVDERFMELRQAQLAAATSGNMAVRQSLLHVPEELQGLYLQVQGGPVGLAHARMNAMETQKPGSAIELGQPVTVPAGILTDVLARRGIRLNRHGSTKVDRCGREGHGPAIAARGRNPEDLGKMFAIASTIDPDLTSNQFERHVDSSNRMLDAGLIQTDTEADELLVNGGHVTSKQGPLYVPPVRRLALVQSPHVSAKFRINHGRDAYASEEAWHNGDPEYNLSFGRLPELHNIANQFLGPVSERLFLGAIAIDAAATALELEELTNVNFQLQVVA